VNSKRLIAVIAFSGMLALANSAAAECAWVLWAHWAGGLVRQQDGSMYNPYRYQTVEAYKSQEACETARRTWTVPKGRP
jgi:hypothetical protein